MGFFFDRRQFLLVLWGVLIFVVGKLFFPALLHRYPGIREATPEEIERFEKLRQG
jgi:hypothetical protein